MSATGFGQFLKATKLPVGTQGLFAKPAATTTTVLYNFSNNAVATSSNLSSQLGSYGAGLSNSSTGVIALAASTANSSKWQFPSSTSIAGAALASTVVNSSAGASTAATGLIMCGGNTPNAIIYTHASSTSSVVSVINNELRGGTTANTTYAIVGVGNGTKTTNKYTWSGGSVTAGTSFQTQTGFYSIGMSAGNANLGVFAQSSTGTNLMQKYVYAGETTAIVSGLALSNTGGCGCGNDTVGVFTVGTATNVYQYSNDAITGGSATFATNIGSGVGVSNGITGVTI